MSFDFIPVKYISGLLPVFDQVFGVIGDFEFSLYRLFLETSLLAVFLKA